MWTYWTKMIGRLSAAESVCWVLAQYQIKLVFKERCLQNGRPQNQAHRQLFPCYCYSRGKKKNKYEEHRWIGCKKEEMFEKKSTESKCSIPHLELCLLTPQSSLMASRISQCCRKSKLFFFVRRNRTLHWKPCHADSFSLNLKKEPSKLLCRSTHNHVSRKPFA